MPVLAWSRSLTPEYAESLGIERRDNPLAVARDSDVVSVHVAATAETRGLCGEDFFAAMKASSLFINTSRGDVVDEAALLAAMDAKGIRAGLDVYADEPSAGTASWQSALSIHPSVMGTHHIGASTDQASDAIADEAIRVVRVFAATGVAPNTVNLESTPSVSHVLSIRHRNRVGLLAAVLHEVRSAGHNVLNMENKLFAGEEAACAAIGLDREPSEALLGRIAKASEHIIAIRVQALGDNPEARA